MFGSFDSSQSLVRRFGITVALCLAMLVLPLAMHHAGAQDPTETDASVRIVHASPDAPAVDVIVDGAVVASNLTFGQITDAISVSPDAHQLQIVPTGPLGPGGNVSTLSLLPCLKLSLGL